MRIGIIGAGRIGQALAQRLVPAGYDIMLANSRGVDAVRDIADHLRCHPGTATDAAVFGDVVIVSVPLNRFAELPIAAIGKRIVIDTCNYYPGRDGLRPELETGKATTSGLLQALLPQARVVKAFNSILAAHLAEGGARTKSGQRHALPIAGDDEAALEIVARIVRDTGLDPVPSGTLANSWRFERARPGYCRVLDADELRVAIGATTVADWVPEGSWRA